MAEKKRKKWYLRWWMFIIYFLVILIIITSIPGGEKKEPEQMSGGKEVSYKIIEEKDISYAGCKRVGIQIVVPDDAIQEDINYTLSKIITDYKSNWDDITIWAWGYSEEKDIGKIGYTKGMKKHSICK